MMTDIPHDLGGRLRHYRESAGLTREDVSVQIGRGAGAIRDWELNQRPPRLVLLSKLATLYGVTIADLTTDATATPASGN